MEEVSNILKVEGVCNRYDENGLGIFGKRKTVKVLDHVSFEIHKNEFLGVVGESGCGKSTLGKAILGLIPFEGTIQVNGLTYSKKNKIQYSQYVQAVFQDPSSALNPKKTIGFTLEEPLKIHHIGNREERREKVKTMLELIGMDSSYLNRYPKELSGGQKQRVCIGAALMMNPRLIIADEAISALDVSVGSQILNLFREIHEKVELSLLFISHNLNVVYYLCDRIVVMYRGHIVELGDAEAVYRRPAHPYTRLLLSAIPDIDAFSDKGKDEVLEKENEEIPDGCPFYHRCPYAGAECKNKPDLFNIAEDGETEHLVRCHIKNS